MKTLLNLSLMLTLLLMQSGCATSSKVTVIDSQSDWVKLGMDVRGHVYLYQKGAWVLQKSPVTLPQGWVAGPPPK